MKTVALTGNIGSGKSTIAKLFKILGAAVYNADMAGHDILLKKDVIVEVINVFGKKMLTNENIDRKKLADIVFNNTSALESLNAIIHPKVLADFKIFAENNKNMPYIIFESALIFESNLNHHFDKLVLVYAPHDLKIKRVMERDECSSENVISRLSKQISDDLKLDTVDFVVRNNDAELVIPQVLALNKELKNN